MKLCEIEFGHVLDASGVRYFFGEGYPFHRLLGPLGPDFDGSTFVAKTTTSKPRQGNMALDKNFQPKKYFPDCVVVKPFQEAVLNAVGLSGPGAEVLLETGLWQKRHEPFFLSFMAVGETKNERITDTLNFLDMLDRYLPDFEAPVGLQINYSCPNAGHYCDKSGMYERDFLSEVLITMAYAHGFGLPAMAKFNILTPIGMVKELCRFDFCDAVCVSNTIPWGQLPESIDWKRIFGSLESPLAKYGGGGLSGKPLLPLVVDWVKRAREAGITKPINAGGGILSEEDVNVLYNAGASSVFIGSVAILRPWRVKKIIDYANALFEQKGE